MKQLLRSKESFSVGLDIGASAVKAVKLKFSKDRIELCGFAFEPVKPGLEPVLKRIAQTQYIKRVNISVSGSSVIIRYAGFPRMSDDELKKALKFEASKHIPFSITEINLDSHVLKQDLPDNKMLVLLAAVKKEFVNQRLKLVESAGLGINIIDIDSIALINAFNFNYSNGDSGLKNKTIALLNIGASISNLNILENGLPALSRDIYIAGNNFTQKIADTLGVDPGSAEDLKLNPGKEKLDSCAKALEPVLSNLAREVRVSFDYYESQSASSVEKIFLSGGGSKFLSLKDTLASLLGMEVEYWDALRQISLTTNVNQDKIKALSNQLPVAVGLALRR